MKELIGTVVVIMGLCGPGRFALRALNDVVRRAALEHVSRGLPSLVKMTRELQGYKSKGKKR